MRLPAESVMQFTGRLGKTEFCSEGADKGMIGAIGSGFSIESKKVQCMKRMQAALFALSLLPGASALAVDTDAVLGGAIGGGVGAAVGSEVGGREGAIAGGAIGAAVGTAVATSGDRDDRDDSRNKVIYVEEHDRHAPPGHAYGHRVPPGHAKHKNKRKYK